MISKMVRCIWRLDGDPHKEQCEERFSVAHCPNQRMCWKHGIKWQEISTAKKRVLRAVAIS